MDFSIPEELKLLQTTVRRYVQEELIPLERPYLAQDRLPLEAVESLERKVKGMGLWALGAPEALGGGGISMVGQCLVQEELYKAMLPPHPANWHGFGGNPPWSLYRCHQEQKERFLLPVIRGEKHTSFAQAEPGGSSDMAGVRTTAIRHTDRYLLNGVKTFVTGAEERTDFWQVLATVDPEKGRAGVTLFLVEKDTPGLEVTRHMRFIGGARAQELTFQDCPVPEGNRLGEEGEGLPLTQGTLNRSRILYGPRSAGLGERCLEMSARYAKQRVTFGQPLANRQAIQWMLANAAVEIECTRWLSYRAAWMVDQGLDIRDMAAKVKLFASEAAGRIVDSAIQVYGVLALTPDMPLARLLQTVRTWRISEGTSEILRYVVARNVLRD